MAAVCRQARAFAPQRPGAERAPVRRASTGTNSDFLQRSVIPTFKFQDSLLRLPVPSLEDTCTKYLSSLQPLVNPSAWTETSRIVREFQNNDSGPISGKQLQAHLEAWAKEHKDTSYISSMWYDMYLEDRSPLPLNLNPQLTWRDDPRPGAMDQAVRAASLVHAAVRFHLTLQAGILAPDVFHTKPHISQSLSFQWSIAYTVPKAVACYPMYAVGAYPLDMSQYQRLFASTRLPVKGRDELFTAGEKAGSTPKKTVRHIVVQRGPRFYALDVLDAAGHVVPSDQLAARFKEVLAHSANARGWDSCGDDGVDTKAAGAGSGYAAEPPVGALTGTHRDEWAAARSRLTSLSQSNADHLRMIDEALLVLTLDDCKPTDHAPVSRTMLHGDGRNRWFDKCLNIIVAANGKAGVAWEHAWGDGAAVLYFFNSVYKASGAAAVPTLAALGSTATAGKDKLTDGVRHMPFILNDELKRDIRAAEARFDRCISATRLRVYQSEALTKEDIKRSRLSPDGVMQAVLQLAHWRAHGYTPVTYESASTAAFKHGRTETIRSATNESAAMCVAFAGRPGIASKGAVPGVADTVAQTSDPTALYNALRASTERHKASTLSAVMGKGVDRHLFALGQWAKRRGGPTPAIFTDPCWAHFRDIRLSTSTLASDALDGGGFGPVNGHSYGAGYGIEERGAHFHVMSYDPGAASTVFPEAEPPKASPVANGYAPVDNGSFCTAVESALQDVHRAIVHGGPSAGVSGTGQGSAKKTGDAGSKEMK